MNVFKKVFTVLATSTMLATLAAPASANFFRSGSSDLSDTLEKTHGFETLTAVLAGEGLLSILDENHVTLFAPTNDVFEATAMAVGCSDAGALAAALAGISIDGTNALTVVLTYHAVLWKIGNERRLVEKRQLNTALDILETGIDSVVKVGVDANGLFVKGNENMSPSAITSDGLSGRKFVIYPINQILLPIGVPADPCGT